MLIFYFAPGTSSMAPHIALYETRAEFEARPLSFHKGEQRQPSYLALNPEGKVPTLVIDGRPLTEVAAILYFLARKYPAAGLFPAGDPEAEAQVISWMSFIASTLHPARTRGVDHTLSVYGIAGYKNDWPPMGCRPIQHRRHSSVPAVLAGTQCAGILTGPVSEPDRPL